VQFAMTWEGKVGEERGEKREKLWSGEKWECTKKEPPNAAYLALWERPVP